MDELPIYKKHLDSFGNLKTSDGIILKRYRSLSKDMIGKIHPLNQELIRKESFPALKQKRTQKLVKRTNQRKSSRKLDCIKIGSEDESDQIKIYSTNRNKDQKHHNTSFITRNNIFAHKKNIKSDYYAVNFSIKANPSKLKEGNILLSMMIDKKLQETKFPCIDYKTSNIKKHNEGRRIVNTHKKFGLIKEQIELSQNEYTKRINQKFEKLNERIKKLNFTKHKGSLI